MIFWPCILKLDGDDELIYLGSEREFVSECQELILTDYDYVIDSTGISYSIEIIKENPSLVKTERVFIIDEVVQLIRANEFVKAELCLTKIHFSTISDAIKSMNY
jgi:hypothetical protein